MDNTKKREDSEGNNQSRIGFTYDPLRHPKGRYLNKVLKKVIWKSIEFVHRKMYKQYDKDIYIYDDARLCAIQDFLYAYIDHQESLLDLAIATQTDIKSTTEIVTATLDQFGLTMSDSQTVADVFARTIGSSQATMDMLSISFSYVGKVTKALKYSLEEISAILGILYNKGFDASMAGNALLDALSSLMNPTNAVSERLKAVCLSINSLMNPTNIVSEQLKTLGISVADVTPETHSMVDILDKLKAAGMNGTDAMKIFGDEAGPAMLALTRSTGDVRELTTSLEAAAGAAETMAAQELKTRQPRAELYKKAVDIVLGLLKEDLRYRALLFHCYNE
jgi:TP901 family phage tail tape measure protein